MVFNPILPRFLTSPWPAIPTTSVAKIKGAIIIFTIFKNTSASGCILTAQDGASQPNKMPAARAKNINVVSLEFFKYSPN